MGKGKMNTEVMWCIKNSPSALTERATYGVISDKY